MACKYREKEFERGGCPGIAALEKLEKHYGNNHIALKEDDGSVNVKSIDYASKTGILALSGCLCDSEVDSAFCPINEVLIISESNKRKLKESAI
jgi:hypothetical protein